MPLTTIPSDPAGGRVPAVVLADNQALTCAGLMHLLPDVPLLTATARRALAVQLEACPSAGVVLDYALFDFNGIENLLIFVRRFPRATWLLASAEFGRDLLRLLAGEPNVGFVTKDAAAAELRAALRALVGGRRYVDAAVREQLAARAETSPVGVLTPAETAVLTLIAAGKTAREIAALRHSSVHTIITHKKNLFRKLQVSTAYEATRYAMRAGLVDPVEYYI